MRDIFYIVGISIIVTVTILAISAGLREEPRRFPIGHHVAVAGEWITNPDGSRVCRLTMDLQTGMLMQPNFCADWTGTPPAFGQTVPWLRSRGSTNQIMVEGEWRP